MGELRFRIAAGIVAAGLALGVAELLAAFIGPDSAPLNTLGATVVDHTPTGLREWVITTFGTNDKSLLYLCMAVVAIIVAALAGAVERTGRPRGTWLLVAFGVIATVVAVGRTGLSGAGPTVIGVAAGVYALRALTARMDDAAATHYPAQVDRTGVPAAVDTAVSTTQARSAAAPSPAVAADADATNSTATASESESPSPVAEHATTSQRSTEASAGTAGNSAPSSRSAIRVDDSTSSNADQPTLSAPQRRQLLRGIAIAGGLAVLTGVGGRWIGAQRRDVSGERAAIQLPEPAAPQVPLAAGADLKLPGLTPYLTANSDFYRIDTALIVPQVSVEDWTLRIHGMVDREIRLSWDELTRRTPVETFTTLACVSNPVGGDLIGNARWRGYRLAELLAEAEPHPDADMVLSHSIDGFTAGSPLAVLTDGRDALLAVGMNGEPLPVAHGYPARLVVPGLYGYVSATKWVTELEITRFDRASAYWTRRGWSARGPIKTGTRIDTPRRGKVKSGRTPIAGVAWAQHVGIRGVEVQIDNGPWQPARLSAEQSIDTWRQWVFDWDATPGSHAIQARATDNTGTPQTEERRDVVPDGATGYPSVTVQVS